MNSISKKPGPPETTMESVLPIVEEHAFLSKREVVTEKIRVSTKIEEYESILEGVLNTENINVERVPMDRIVDVVPSIRFEGDVTIIPVIEERAVMIRQLVLVEEVHVRKSTSPRTVTAPVTLRRHRVVIEDIGAEAAPSTKPSTT
jgi:stress response protein YsnF